jgi:pimeloyl-ACP methyl ester carboxylesterase
VAAFRINSQGESLHYRVRGRGECVLLLHGLGSSGADWELQIRALQRQFRLIVPDLPGSGHQTPASEKCSIPGFAATLWALLDHLGVARVSVIGFSLGGAVALEMALQRPDSVPRLVLINSLASYQIDHWCKWLEARIPPLLVGVFGMRRMARLIAKRLFPKPCQEPLRRRAFSVVSAVPARRYLAMASALEAWSATDRLDRLKSKTLIIAAEHDYTPLEEKHALAAALHAEIVVVRGSRHGTPFDSIEATNAALMALLSDRTLPPSDRWVCDKPEVLQRIAVTCGLAEQTGPSSLPEGQRSLRTFVSALMHFGSRSVDSQQPRSGAQSAQSRRVNPAKLLRDPLLDGFS